jgi:hypothetical protein
MALLYRGMRPNQDGLPRVGPSARMLGIRDDGSDIEEDEEGLVHPYTGGMSVGLTPDDLPEFRRPPEFGGTGDDPLWVIDEDDLVQGLRYTEDVELPGHGFIEPAWSMRYDEYEDLLALTREDWKPA